MNTSVCSLQFNIPDNLKPPVLLYYRLTNFYQNHRRYVKSLDSNQLKGDAINNNSLGACSPLNTDPDGKPYWPCGLIANSIFNDSFANPVQLNVRDSSALNTTYNMTKNGIAWNSDKALYAATKYDPADISPPPNWHLRYQDNYTSENLPDLESDEGFQVWMRTAGLPNFSKLAMRNDNETMQCGMYQVDIQNSMSFASNLLPRTNTWILDFPVDIYGGTKSLVISTRTVMGGKNPFLGIAYVAVGGICIVLGTLFTVTHLFKPRYVLLRFFHIMAGGTDDIVSTANLETIRICHGTMTNPVQRPQPGFQDQVMMPHDPLTQHRRLYVCFDGMMLGVLVIIQQLQLKRANEYNLEFQISIANHLVRDFL